jgi:hypothetical protein
MAVIAHKDVPVSNVSPADLEAIFTTRKIYWSAGKRITAFNFPPKHPVRVAFDSAVLHLDPDEVARYWIDRKVRGGHRPPRQVTSGALMLRVVEKLPGSVGYVPIGEITDGVKVIAEVT